MRWGWSLRFSALGLAACLAGPLEMPSTADRYTLSSVHVCCVVLLHIYALVLVLWLQQFADLPAL